MTVMEVALQFRLPGKLLSAEPFGNGHINNTYRIGLDGKTDCLLQQINTAIFRKPEQVQQNILSITSFLKEKIAAEGGDPLRETLTPVLTHGNTSFLVDDTGAFWRMYLFVPGTRSCEQPISAEELFEAGRAFGIFERRLSMFPEKHLFETIPDFHNTPARACQLESAIQKDRTARVHAVQDEIRFCYDRMEKTGLFEKAYAAGQIRKRVTHNDTKANNALLDVRTGKALCVCDLDTVMPGFAAYDFGDAIRYGASLANEDEADLSKVAFSVNNARAYAEGFLQEAGGIFPADERQLLADGIWMITFEQAMRFLTDYLDGDRYYRTAYPEHNLIRARNQMALVREIERYSQEIRALVR